MSFHVTQSLFSTSQPHSLDPIFLWSSTSPCMWPYHLYCLVAISSIQLLSSYSSRILCLFQTSYFFFGQHFYHLLFLSVSICKKVKVSPYFTSRVTQITLCQARNGQDLRNAYTLYQNFCNTTTQVSFQNFYLFRNTVQLLMSFLGGFFCTTCVVKFNCRFINANYSKRITQFSKL